MFGAFLCAFVGWRIWPEGIEGYGFGMIAVALWAAALRSAVSAVGTMIKVHRRERTIADLMKSAKPVKSADLARAQQLRDAGMIDD